MPVHAVLHRVNDPMPPFDGTTYAEATPADVLDQSNYWKHKCVRPKWGPFFVSKLKATQAQATHLQQRTLEAVPLAWPVALRTSRTCYGADYVPHGRKCKFVVDGWLSHAHQVKMKLAKVLHTLLALTHCCPKPVCTCITAPLFLCELHHGFLMA